MKAFLTFLCFASVAFAGPTIVYVSESLEKRIAVWSLDEKTGELTRQSETALPGAPGSLALSPDRIQTDPSNRFAFVPHVGELNKVEQLRFDAQAGTLTRNTPPHLPGGAGEGPRHMQFHPNGKWAYFVNEQGKSVTLCDYDAEKGTLKARQSVPTVPDDWRDKGSCADIHISADGRFVYASNRGHDSLAVFSVNLQTGELTPHGQTPTEKTPRSFCLVPGDQFVVSAGEGSHKLIVFRRDAQNGTLTPLKTYDCGKGPAWVTSMKLN